MRPNKEAFTLSVKNTAPLAFKRHVVREHDIRNGGHDLATVYVESVPYEPVYGVVHMMMKRHITDAQASRELDEKINKKDPRSMGHWKVLHSGLPHEVRRQMEMRRKSRQPLEEMAKAY